VLVDIDILASQPEPARVWNDNVLQHVSATDAVIMVTSPLFCGLPDGKADPKFRNSFSQSVGRVLS
jgi:hypothetical protein